MAARLALGLQQVAGARLLQEVQANEIFLALPEKIVAALEKAGFGFYRWPLSPASDGVPIRLVTSYATVSAEVDDFIGMAQQLAK